MPNAIAKPKASFVCAISKQREFQTVIRVTYVEDYGATFLWARIASTDVPEFA